jgi:hypothetical protein
MNIDFPVDLYGPREHMMAIQPLTIGEAKLFVAKHHRHNNAPVGGLFACGLSFNGELVGAAIAGRPVARLLDNGATVEITRVCTIGHRNANSMLYGSILRAAAALGYDKAITYTLSEESGSSLKAVGFVAESTVANSNWNRPSRTRVDKDLFGNATKPQGQKIRWVKALQSRAA